ncbi:MAG: hypothetical protein JNM57_07265 [Cyclobacteriaceae bacterium]|nr:hypothetical protein [Cyclobacteriaceae bacterium]
MKKITHLIFKASFIFTGLLITLSLIATTCEDEPEVSASQKVQDYLTAGSWRVTYFFDDTEETTDFTGYSFTFSDNGTVSTTNGVNTVSGTWTTLTSDSGLKLVLDFGTTVPFDELNDDWKIQESTSIKIRLEDVSGGSGGTDYLTLEKI